MKWILRLLGIALMAFLGSQLYRLYSDNAGLGKTTRHIGEEIESLKSENEELQADIHHFSDSENLAKELKSKFDYKRPGEKLIKIQ